VKKGRFIVTGRDGRPTVPERVYSVRIRDRQGPQRRPEPTFATFLTVDGDAFAQLR